MAVRRFETPAGKQAQVDWGHLGEIETAGKTRKLWGFVFTLGPSRAMMAAAATDQKLPTLLRMHEEAFRQLGGVPKEILYDRMKIVLEGTDDRGETQWNQTFQDFARYWGFTARACKPYRAQTKGKVESGAKYVRRNFLCGRTATSLEDLNDQLRGWASAGLVARSECSLSDCQRFFERPSPAAWPTGFRVQRAQVVEGRGQGVLTGDAKLAADAHRPSVRALGFKVTARVLVGDAGAV